MRVIVCIYFIFCVLSCVLILGIKAKHGKSSNLQNLYGATATVYENGVPAFQNDDEDYLDGDDEDISSDDSGKKNVSINAEFRSKPLNISSVIGNTVRLPCEVNNAAVVLIWIKDDKILYLGDVDFKKTSNIYKNGSYLEVKLESELDFGKYQCKMMVSTEYNPVIEHMVIPGTLPAITSFTPVGYKTVYRLGERLQLNCLASGQPHPNISWHKDNERLEVEGETLIIEQLKFTDSGNYRCLADNKIEPPAYSNITIHIEHKPVVSVKKYIVYTDKEYDAELHCTVRAYPPAVLTWKRNNIEMKSNISKIKIERRESNAESVLIITKLEEEDFGSYYCLATNSLGKDEKKIDLVKTPALIDKPRKLDKDVILMWRVESSSSIIEHELLYKKIGEGNWTSVKPELTKDEKNVYTVKYAIKDLDADDYEIKVRSRNSHGWSEYADTISVTGGTNTSSCTVPVTSIATVSITILIIFRHLLNIA